MELFKTRWGGYDSLSQELEDLAIHLPFWLRPIWKALISWLKPYIRKAQIQNTMAQVDRQAEEIGDKWATAERAVQVNMAVEKARAEFPEAKVSVQKMPKHSCDAVLIEHPPDPKDPTQVALGFGALEVRAPYRTD